jgi:hypothetical protein
MYLMAMRSVFHAVGKRLADDGYCIAMVQNARAGDRMVPQAWDLARILGSLFEPCEERILLYPERGTMDMLRAGDSTRTDPMSTDPMRTDRTHEYALVFRKRRPCIDVEEGRAILRWLSDEGVAFEIVGSFRAWMDDAPAISTPRPSDIDLIAPDDAEGLRALLHRLADRSFRFTLWGEPVNADVRPETVRAHHYLRAERLGSDGSLLRIDIALADP